MIEIISHLFVWIVSPAAVFGTAIYALIRKELFLGTFASAAVLFACAAIATRMFDGHLLSYRLIYTTLLSAPGLLLLALGGSLVARSAKFLQKRPKLTSTDTHVL